MKKYFYTTLFLVFIVLSASAQFLSETDVLYYLNGKKFIKESVGATLSFSDMGSRLTVNGSYLMYQPDIRILSRSMAVVTYYGIEDPSAKAGLVVNGSTNRIVDRSNNSVYTLEDLSDNNDYSQNENQNTNRSANMKPIANKNTIKDPISVPKLNLNTFINTQNSIIKIPEDCTIYYLDNNGSPLIFNNIFKGFIRDGVILDINRKVLGKIKETEWHYLVEYLNDNQYNKVYLERTPSFSANCNFACYVAGWANVSKDNVLSLNRKTYFYIKVGSPASAVFALAQLLSMKSDDKTYKFVPKTW